MIPLLCVFIALWQVHEPSNGGVASEKGQIILIALYAVSQAVQFVREYQNRRWQEKDARAKTEQLVAHEVKMTDKIDSQTQDLKNSMRTRVTDFNTRLNELLEESERRRGNNG